MKLGNLHHDLISFLHDLSISCYGIAWCGCGTESEKIHVTVPRADAPAILSVVVQHWSTTGEQLGLKGTNCENKGHEKEWANQEDSQMCTGPHVPWTVGGN